MNKKLILISVIISLFFATGCSGSEIETLDNQTTEKPVVDKVLIKKEQSGLKFALSDSKIDDSNNTYIISLDGESTGVEIKGINLYISGFGSNDGVKITQSGKTNGWVFTENYIAPEDKIIAAMISLSGMDGLGDVLKITVDKDKYDINNLPSSIEVWGDIVDGQRTLQIEKNNISINNL